MIAGGVGTRLRPLTLMRPKPLMPLVDSPLLEYQLAYLRTAGITEVCFATNYMSEAVDRQFGDGRHFGVSLTYAVEDVPLDTAGAIRNAYDQMPGDDCVVFNGDTIHAFDIAEIIELHRRRQAEVTLTLRKVERPHPYGVVPIDEDCRVEGFREPSEEQKRAIGGDPTGEFDAINAGLYVMNKSALESIPQRRCNIEREVFPLFVSEGRRIYGDIQQARWIDIGRPSQYLEAVAAVVAGEIQSPRPFLKRGDAAIHATAEVADSATVSCHSSVGQGVRIEDEAYISASAIFDGVRVGSSARIENSIIGDGCEIGPNAVVRDTVLGAGCVVKEFSLLGGFS